MANDQKHPPIWNKRETESDKAYAAFLLYRDLGRGRSLDKASSTFDNPSSKLRQMGTWSSQHDWVKRCQAWDAYQQAKDETALDELRQKKRVEIVNAELEDYEKLRTQWLEQSQYIRPVDVKTQLDDGRQVNILKVTPYEFKAHIESRKKISEGLRLFAELPNSIDRHEHGGVGGKPIQIEPTDYREIAKLLKPPTLEDDDDGETD
jgi:hypothetical protein